MNRIFIFNIRTANRMSTNLFLFQRLLGNFIRFLYLNEDKDYQFKFGQLLFFIRQQYFIILLMSEENGLIALKNRKRLIEKERKIKIDITKTQYPLIRSVASNQIGWTLWSREDQKGDANVFWSDTYVTQQFVKRLKPYQRVNHFPNSQQLGKKNLLSDNIKKFKTMFSHYYNFYPQTWILPQQLQYFGQDSKQSNESADKKSNKWYIVKPSASSQGKGIYLTKHINTDIKQQQIVQQYIMNPLLIQGCKFDLRIYVFIKSLSPLKIFRFEQGLMRLSTVPYEAPNKVNKANLHMHLTNYAINKHNPTFVQNKCIQQCFVGHKRSLTAIYNYLQKVGCNKVKIQQQIDQIIVKTILSAYPKLLNSYRQCRDMDLQYESVCFQILGFDILIDSDFKPWLLQVNHSPSFCTQSPLDQVVKKYLILDTLLLLNLNSQDKESYLKYKPKQKEINIKDKDAIRIKKKSEQIYQQAHLGGYTRLFPNNKQCYTSILSKLNQKKPKYTTQVNKIQNKIEQPELETGDTPSNLNNPPSLSTRKRNALTIYGKFRDKNKQKPQNFYNIETQQSNQKQFFFQKQRKKYIESIKVNNVNISFLQNAKTQYSNGFLIRRLISNQKSNISRHQPSHSVTFESKTSEGGRIDLKKLDFQIRNRIQKMKLARIKMHRMKSKQSKQRQFQSNSHRIMSHPLRQQLRGESKFI